MSEDTLFDPTPYDDGTARRRRARVGAPERELVPTPPGYHLITNRSGVKGFHRTKVPEAAMAKRGSVVTFCGIIGRRIDEYPREIPLCADCEAVNDKD